MHFAPRISKYGAQAEAEDGFVHLHHRTGMLSKIAPRMQQKADVIAPRARSVSAPPSPHSPCEVSEQLVLMLNTLDQLVYLS